MKFIEEVKQVQEFGEAIYKDDQEGQWEAYKRRSQKDGYDRYLSNSGYQPHPLPKNIILSPPNRGSSVQPPKKDISITSTEYNHLVNEKDWYKKRMEEYRDSFWNIVKLIKDNKDRIPEDIYNEVIEEDGKY